MRHSAFVFLLLFSASVSSFRSALAGEDALAAKLLSEARDAAGGALWDRAFGLRAEGDENDGGMRGQWRALDDIETGRMRRASDFGIVRTDEVWDGARHWRQDISGGVHPLDSDFACRLAATDAWIASRSYLKPSHGGASLGPVETRQQDGRTYDIVAATPPGGEPIDLWFDAHTHLLARTHRLLSINAETVIYDDYRKVGGLVLPFSITTDDDDPNGIDRVRVTAYRVVPRLDSLAFARPVPPDDTVVAGGKVTVPMRFDGEIIVSAMLNGKGPYSFILDTGGHDIVTPEAAKAIGLKPEGAGSGGGAGAGTLPEQFAHVDTLAIGGVTVKNQPFFVIPLQYDTVDDGPRPPLAGLLGLELFERMAIRIDYVGQTLTFQPLGAYRHDGPGTPVPIRFYDDIPMIDASLDGNSGPFTVDTGNSGTLVVQHVWADRVGLGPRMKRGLAMTSFGAGGQSRNWASRLGSLAVAGTNLTGVIARYAGDAKGAFSSRVEAGNIGNQILPFFALDFDYARQQIWFEPRPGFTALPFNRSGMSFYKGSPDAFTVANVLEFGPAAAAGLGRGDQVTEIDGVAASRIDRYDLLRSFTRPEGTRVRLSYLHDGKSTETVIVLRDLLP